MRAILVPAVMTVLSFCGYHAYSTHSHHRGVERTQLTRVDGRGDRGSFSPRFQPNYYAHHSFRGSERPDCQRQCHFHDRGEQTPAPPHQFNPDSPHQVNPDNPQPNPSQSVRF
jgi:hypothetical protein